MVFLFQLIEASGKDGHWMNVSKLNTLPSRNAFPGFTNFSDLSDPAKAVLLEGYQNIKTIKSLMMLMHNSGLS